MDKLELIDYDNCITNLTSSIEAHYGLTPSYKTMPIVDNELKEKDYQNVIVMVFDAMGSAIIKKNTTENSFLSKRKVADFKSTFPPTTANCTTAYVSGKNPIETGWLGWSTYFEEINQTVDNFTNDASDTKIKIDGENIASKYLGYEQLGTRIEKSNSEVKYYRIGPAYFPIPCISLKQMENRLIKICNEPGKKYIYLYWENPDHYMHTNGTKNDGVKKILNQISKFLQNIERKTRDTIAFVSADHGQIDVKEIAFYTYFDLMSCLRTYPSCDSRTSFFFVKDEKKKEFAELFNKNFSDYYLLLTKEEALKNNIFGYGTKNEKIDKIVGDFVAIATSDHYFSFTPNGMHFTGHHAGLVKDEIEIPLIIIKN